MNGTILEHPIKESQAYSVQDFFFFFNKKSDFVNASIRKSTSHINDSSFLHANVKATINRKAKNVWLVLGFLFKLFPTTWTLHYKFGVAFPKECVCKKGRSPKKNYEL